MHNWKAKNKSEQMNTARANEVIGELNAQHEIDVQIIDQCRS